MATRTRTRKPASKLAETQPVEQVENQLVEPAEDLSGISFDFIDTDEPVEEPEPKAEPKQRAARVYPDDYLLLAPWDLRPEVSEAYLPAKGKGFIHAADSKCLRTKPTVDPESREEIVERLAADKEREANGQKPKFGYCANCLIRYEKDQQVEAS